MRNVLLATAALTLIAAPALAQDPASPVTGSLGYTHLDADDGELGAITGRLGYDFTRNFGIEGEASVGVKDEDVTIAEVAKAHGKPIEYKVGTMIELPRAAIRAGDLAENAEFFSFGTNDLTQTTFGISRDDSGRFLQAYMDKGIFETDPFVRLDRDGVGDLIRIAAERGRAVRPDVKLGICGEHGGDPSSIAFCEEVGLAYVSCSPYRVPIARLAAAQAALHAKAGTEHERDR